MPCGGGWLKTDKEYTRTHTRAGELGERPRKLGLQFCNHIPKARKKAHKSTARACFIVPDKDRFYHASYRACSHENPLKNAKARGRVSLFDTLSLRHSLPAQQQQQQQYSSTNITTMDPEDIAQFWEAKAAEWDPVNAPLVVWDELVLIADTTPQLLPEATSAAARAVGKRFCCHGDNEPQPLPDIRDLAARRTAAQQHPGLCGYHHSRWIGDVDFSKAAERSSGGQVTAKRLRNQVSIVQLIFGNPTNDGLLTQIGCAPAVRVAPRVL